MWYGALMIAMLEMYIKCYFGNCICNLCKLTVAITLLITYYLNLWGITEHEFICFSLWYFLLRNLILFIINVIRNLNKYKE